MSLTSEQYAALANDAYKDYPVGVPPPGREPRFEYDGVTFKILEHVNNRATGYQGTVYQRVDTGEIVVAHRGTEFSKLKTDPAEFAQDLLRADAGMVLGRVNSQAGDAIALTGRAKEYAEQNAEYYGGRAPQVTVTGHSLGGTLAQISAHHFGLKGETFNAYGAVSLSYRIPEGGRDLINHVMAHDMVGAGSHHYGQVRVYATAQAIDTLREYGYDNNRNPLDLRRPISAAVSSMVRGSHDMHLFLPVDRQGRPDTPVQDDPQASRLAAQYDPMIDKYRADVNQIRAGLSMGGDGIDIFRYGPMFAPMRTGARIGQALRDDLEPGEPARREAGGRAPEPATPAAPGRTPAAPLPGIGAPLEEARSRADRPNPYEQDALGLRLNRMFEAAARGDEAALDRLAEEHAQTAGFREWDQWGKDSFRQWEQQQAQAPQEQHEQQRMRGHSL